MNTLPATNRLTSRISVPCTPEMKKRLQENAQKAQLSESEYIRRIVENNTNSLEPASIDEATRRALAAVYHQQLTDYEHLKELFEKTGQELSRIDNMLYDPGNLRDLRRLKDTLFGLLSVYLNTYKARSEDRLQFYCDVYANNYKTLDLLQLESSEARK